MDENTKIIVDGLSTITKQNTETNRQLKELNKTTTLKESIEDNRGEILTSIALGAAESATDRAIAKGHNLGVGVTAKAGVDIIPGGEPSVDEKQTLFGITKEFYAKHTVQSLIDSLGQVNETLIKQANKENEVIHLGHTNKTTMEKLLHFFRSDSGDGFFGGLADKIGLTKLRQGIGKFFNAKERRELFNKFGQIVGTKLKLGFFKIVDGLKSLGRTLLKPLGNIVKGILGLPKKILGFFGGALDILGRLLFLGGGIFALAKLTEFLRNVSPEGRKKFVDGMVKGTEAILKGLEKMKDYIIDVLIPVLKIFGAAVLSVAKFIGKITGAYKEGNIEREMELIREENKASGVTMSEDQMLQLARRRAGIKMKMRDIELVNRINKMGRKDIGVIKNVEDLIGKSNITFRGADGDLYYASIFNQESLRKFRGTLESSILGTPLPGTADLEMTKKHENFLEELEQKKQKALEERRQKEKEEMKNNQSSVNAGVSVAQIDNSHSFVNDREAVTIAGNAFNYSVYG